MNVKSIYEQAIGARFEQLHPLLKKKYGKQLGALTATGTMNHIRGSVVYRPVTRIFARDDFLFPERGKNVPFTITNTYHPSPQVVDWNRTFYFQKNVRTFFARMYWDASSEQILDRLGRSGRFMQPLVFTVTSNGALLITSEQSFIRLFGRYVKLPKRMSAKVNVYEEAIDDEHIHIFVHITLIGTVMMYEGVATIVEQK